MQRRMAKYWVERESEIIRSSKILLVDDDSNGLEYHAEVLAAQGQNVSAVNSYEEGERLAERGDFDLVVVGQGGPGFRGRAIVERATDAIRQIPVVVLADVADMDLYLEAMAMGALDYIQKPVTSAKFRGVLNAVGALAEA